MSEANTRTAVTAITTGSLLTLLGANAVRNLIGWPGYLTVCALLLALSVGMMLRQRPEQFRWYRIPKSLVLFLALAALSPLWSAYPAMAGLGALAQLATSALAVCLAFVTTWPELIRSCGLSLRILLGGSLLFELFVSLVVRERVLPLWLERPEGAVSPLLWWCRNQLLTGGPIQGLLGSSVLLGFLALLGGIVFSVQLAGRSIRPATGWFWLGIAALVLVLTRPATVIIATAAVALAAAFALWARRLDPAKRKPLYLTAAVLAALAVPLITVFREALLALLGKSSTLTGRTDIWDAVIGLAQQHPTLGWGWVSYWPTWVAPFAGLIEKNGLPVPHAHNAWLDVWLQLGWIGVVCFALLVGLTLWRSWFRAIDRPQRFPHERLPYAASTLLPLLLLVALIVQSLSESRILSEGGWLLLTLMAVKTKADYEVPSTSGDAPLLAWRNVPLR